MRLEVCTGKLHRVRVTGAELDYEGSITLCPRLMNAAGIREFQLVHINGLRAAAHWETYAVRGGPGDVILNGPPAHLFEPGDIVVVNAFRSVRECDVYLLHHVTVLVDEQNEILERKLLPMDSRLR